MNDRRVVVTGRGVVSPLGVGFEAHWHALVRGESAVASSPRLERLALGASRAGAIDPDLLQPHLNQLPRKQQKLYNRPTLLAMLASGLAMEDAGLEPGARGPDRFGVLLGVNIAGWDVEAMTRYLVEARSEASPAALDMVLANRYCMQHINPLDFSLKTLPNLTAGHVAIAQDARAACRAMTDGAIGGAQAIGQAWRMIQDGDLDAALCGGSDAQLEELLYAMYAGAGVLASDSGDPGMVTGEGSGVLVLETADRAQKRGARLRAEMLGFASAAGDGRLPDDGESGTLAARLAQVIRDAVDEAGAAPDVVIANGDGVPAHDEAESQALREALGIRAATVPVLTMKPAHGHLGAASVPVELIASSAVLEHGVLPPLGAVTSVAASRRIERALVLSVGLFGECAAIVLGAIPCASI